jgi:hypothetical protein
LHFAWRDLGYAELTEEGPEVKPQANLVSLHPAGGALALGDDLVFLLELVGGLVEGLLGRLEQPCAALAAELEIPVLGDLFGERETVLAGAFAPLRAADRGRTVPGGAVRPSIDLDLPAQDFVSF